MYSAAHTIHLQLMGGGSCARGAVLRSEDAPLVRVRKAGNQERSLSFPPSEAGRGTAADQTPDAGLGVRGRCWGLC